uniref:Uncharacterized protein n=2 Tax=Avena sativa TaxID=4498 RepID=A0ACD5X187_AVESA
MSDRSQRRKSLRLKDIHVIYSEDRETEFYPLMCIKTEFIDPEEATSCPIGSRSCSGAILALPSPSETNVASVADNEVEKDVSLRDLRARYKAKTLKTQNLSMNLENEKPYEEVDLDEPLIALKQKRQKTSLHKAKKKIDAPANVEDTMSKRDRTSPIQACSLDTTLHYSRTVKPRRRAPDLEHSEIENAIDHSKEMVRKDICSAEVENRICCRIETLVHEEAAVSTFCEKNSFEHSCVELHQVPLEDNGCVQQPGFIIQPIELNVSDHSCELTHSVEAYLDDNVLQNKTANIVSSSDCIDEVSNHQTPLDDISISDVNTSSTGSELLLCSVSQSCDDHIDKDEYCYSENIKAVEDSSLTDEIDNMQSDSCGSTEGNCTSPEAVQMEAEGQLDSVVCHGVRTNDMLLHMNVEQAATDYNFSFDKILDLVHPANFDTPDGQLESIVFDALNNHVQRKRSDTKTFLGVSDSAVILSPPDEANTAHDSQLFSANDMAGSPKDMNQLNYAMSSDICRSVNDQVSIEDLGFQHQLFQACVDMDQSGCVPSESSSVSKEIQEIPAGASNPVNHQKTSAQTKNSEFYTDEESIEEHTPKKLLSKRKIMSPTSQEKLCHALTGIDLRGVERLKKKIYLADCDKNRQTLPPTTSRQDQSVLSTDRKIKDRTLSCPSKGALKSTESQSPQQTTCACMKKSSVLLDPRKAVEFSERQMHDIESIAANLIRSLKHMRSIVDASLSSEALTLLPNFDSAEIRAASEDALEVERTTRKWLTIMNKDCNRFCKILTLEGKKAASHSEVMRKRRKITFADEAGGTLCHVKVFSDGQTSLPSECLKEL